jgi:hypothetical protein
VRRNRAGVRAHLLLSVGHRPGRWLRSRAPPSIPPFLTARHPLLHGGVVLLWAAARRLLEEQPEGSGQVGLRAAAGGLDQFIGEPAHDARERSRSA